MLLLQPCDIELLQRRKNRGVRLYLHLHFLIIPSSNLFSKGFILGNYLHINISLMITLMLDCNAINNTLVIGVEIFEHLKIWCMFHLFDHKNPSWCIFKHQWFSSGDMTTTGGGTQTQSSLCFIERLDFKFWFCLVLTRRWTETACHHIRLHHRFYFFYTLLMCKKRILDSFQLICRL